MRRLDQGDAEASLQDQRVFAIELDGIGAGFRKREPNQIEVQLHDYVDLGKLNLAVNFGYDMLALIVDNPQPCGALSPAIGK